MCASSIFMRFLIGVDGGGSSTRAVVVVPGKWQVLGRGAAGSGNLYTVGAQKAAENCCRAIQRALDDARRTHPGLSLETVSAYGFGLAGVRREQDAQQVSEQLKEQLQTAAVRVLETDAVAAHYGAFLGEPGVMLSGGTGAICLGIDSENNRFYADGWGPHLGDLGSGYWIGQEALRAVCRVQDEQTGNSFSSIKMGKVLLERLGLEDWDTVIRWFYAPETSRDQIAQLALTVFELANGGETMANRILDQAASHLADTTIWVFQRVLQAQVKSCDQPFVGLPICLRGGVFADRNFEKRVRTILEERLALWKQEHAAAPTWRFVVPRFEADVGAAFCAEKLLLSLC